MAVVEILMPRMGESVMEGTILAWLKNVGDSIEEEESLLEVATDKVDTDIPSPYAGVLKEILAKEGDIVQVDSPIAIIETDQSIQPTISPTVSDPAPTPEPIKEILVTQPSQPQHPTGTPKNLEQANLAASPIQGRFYSPLVLNIARTENIGFDILERIVGTGKEDRVTKKDILSYIESVQNNTNTNTNGAIKQAVAQPPIEGAPVPQSKTETPTANYGYTTDQTTVAPPVQKEEPPKYINPNPQPVSKPAISVGGQDQIVEMDRMRKIIADRMLESRKISAHVTSFVEADVTNIVYWRNRMKHDFKDKEDAILTFTPIFMEAVIKAIKDYPAINVSVSGDSIVYKKDVNIGLAVALQDNNLIVPVIKQADQLNLIGLTKQVNDLAKRARAGKLKPDELEGGTFTVSNVGSFGNVMGTPIIVQPQVAILALGAVVKKPAVVETSKGDTIGIRHLMMLSHSYDHRVVDGSLGGMFVRRVADYLEKFDLNRDMY